MRGVVGRRRGALALLAAVALSGPASHGARAAEAQSLYTSLANKDCHFLPMGRGEEDAEDQRKFCPGAGGIKVIVSALGRRVRIGFAWGDGKKQRSKPSVVEAWSAGEKVEWRGLKEADGFKPYAATVRMIFPKDDGPQAGHQLLAVMRVGPDQACLLSVIDLTANAQGYELARSMANQAPGIECASHRPQAEGIATEWTQRLLQPVTD